MSYNNLHDHVELNPKNIMYICPKLKLLSTRTHAEQNRGFI